MVEITDTERVQIAKIYTALNSKFSTRQYHSVNGLMQVMDEIEKEAASNFMDIGFLVSVDTSPMLAGSAPIITVQERIGSLFDREKAGWEVLKSRETGEKFYGETTIDA